MGLLVMKIKLADVTSKKAIKYNFVMNKNVINLFKQKAIK